METGGVLVNGGGEMENGMEETNGDDVSSIPELQE